MLDQSFAVENLRSIFDFENRKGLNLEEIYFPEVGKITKKIKRFPKPAKKIEPI